MDAQAAAEAEEEGRRRNRNNDAAGFDEFDPVALGLHNGSLSETLAYSMNEAVEYLRTNTARSIE
jgi:hypothetical protein